MLQYTVISLVLCDIILFQTMQTKVGKMFFQKFVRANAKHLKLQLKNANKSFGGKQLFMIRSLPPHFHKKFIVVTKWENKMHEKANSSKK